MYDENDPFHKPKDLTALQAPTGITKGPTADAGPGGFAEPFDGPWMTDYNNGSAPDIPLGGGMQGWDWDGSRWWQTPNAPAPPPTGGGDGPPPPPPPAAPAAFAPPAAAPAAAPAVKQPGITDEVTKILMARLKDLQNPGDVASDPIYQQAVKAYQIGQLRSADKQRKSLAERSAATTGTTRSGGFNVGVQGINERSGENAAQYRSGLALDRLGAREQQLVQAIQMARAVGQDDIANQLELQRLQLQQELGRGDLALRGELGYGNLGLSYADLIQRANRDATLSVLGGG